MNGGLCARTLVIACLIAGCTSLPENMPLVFSQTITFGASIGASPTEQDVDVTIGFKSRDVAVVPVTTGKNGVKLLNAKITNIESAEKASVSPDGVTEYTNPKNSGESFDALSVFGQFSSATDASTRSVGLGKFFATGAAAQVLSQGFQDCLGAGTCNGVSNEADPDQIPPPN